MKIDAHGHGMHADLDANGRRIPPLMPAWRNTDMTTTEHIRRHNELGIEKVLLLDPPEIAFELKQVFGDFVLPCPMVRMDECSPGERQVSAALRGHPRLPSAGRLPYRVSSSPLLRPGRSAAAPVMDQYQPYAPGGNRPYQPRLSGSQNPDGAFRKPLVGGGLDHAQKQQQHLF